MRSVVLFFLFCVLFQIKAWTMGQTENPRNDKIFTIPEISAVDPPVVDYIVFPEKNFPHIVINDLPAVPYFIMGKGEAEAELLASFLLNENSNADKEFVKALAGFYIAEAETEGINHDIAFAQMCLETGFLRFGGLVVPEMNNFCGLGSIGPGEEGIWFSSAELGVRAHIQHLKAYASDKPLQGELVDPRYRFVRKGSALTLNGLSGTWAADKLYAEKIELILCRLYLFRNSFSK